MEHRIRIAGRWAHRDDAVLVWDDAAGTVSPTYAQGVDGDNHLRRWRGLPEGAARGGDASLYGAAGSPTAVLAVFDAVAGSRYEFWEGLGSIHFVLRDFRHDPADFLALLFGASTHIVSDHSALDLSLEYLEQQAGVRLPDSLRDIVPTPGVDSLAPGLVA